MNKIKFNAIYGTFNKNMVPMEVNNVSSKIAEQFSSDGTILIPANTDFNQVFGNPAFGKRKFLQVNIGERRHNIIEDDYSHDIKINLYDQKKRLKLVYYVYINRISNWKKIVSGQLLQLKSYGLFDEADIYIHITESTSNYQDVINVVQEICPAAIISTSSENLFEYPALKLIYDLAIADPDCICMYVHTKGMSYNIQSRLSDEVALTTGTFENWRKHLESFNDKRISRAGLFPAVDFPRIRKKYGTKGGWFWCNFWYAKGSYIINYCELPKIDKDRIYFEVWLGGKLDYRPDPTECHSTYERKKVTYFSAAEAREGIADLIDIIEEAGNIL